MARRKRRKTRKTAKRRKTRKTSKKGHVPLSILKARYKKLGNIIKRRS